MKGDLRETAIDHVSGEKFATFYSSETKWINYMQKLKEQYPDEVEITYTNPDGSINAHIPASWFKIKPKKKVVMTEEQIAAAKARLENGRKKRLDKMMGGDDADVSEEKEQ